MTKSILGGIRVRHNIHQTDNRLILIKYQKHINIVMVRGKRLRSLLNPGVTFLFLCH